VGQFSVGGNSTSSISFGLYLSWHVLALLLPRCLICQQVKLAALNFSPLRPKASGAMPGRT
jgi:hypothetical protein